MASKDDQPSSCYRMVPRRRGSRHHLGQLKRFKQEVEVGQRADIGHGCAHILSNVEEAVAATSTTPKLPSRGLLSLGNTKRHDFHKSTRA